MARTCFLCGNSEKPFFEFPHCLKLRKKWFRILGKQYQLANLSDRDVICVKHFRQSNLIHGKNSFKLKKGAVPITLVDQQIRTTRTDVMESSETITILPPSTTILPPSSEATAESQPVDTSTVPHSSPPSDTIKEKLPAEKKERTREDNSFYYASDAERIALIMGKKFSFLQEQIPLKLTAEEEQEVREIVYDEHVFKKATKHIKVHCTVCDKHLGASPIAQFDRFVHPILNTLMCETCFVFYNTGEFTTDDDGSEIYCKWCAQGGTVMCCSDCSLVFCKECVERNLGTRICEEIANADTWECFGCKPKQLHKLHVMCSAVHEYTMKLIKHAIDAEDKELLQRDVAMCCKSQKRKHIVEDCAEHSQTKKLKVTQPVLKGVEFAEVSKPKSTVPAETTQNKEKSKSASGQPLLKIRAIPTALLQNPTTPAPLRKILPAPMLGAASSPPPLVPTTVRPPPASSTGPPPLRPVIPSATAVTPTSPATATLARRTPVRLAWLRRALDTSHAGVNVYLQRSGAITRSLGAPKNHAQLADLHNKMQHAMSQCTNMLIDARKRMHQEFLDYLTTMQVSHSSIGRNGTSTVILPKVTKPPQVLNSGAGAGSARKTPAVVLKPASTPSGLKVVNARPMLVPASSGARQPQIVLRPGLAPIAFKRSANVLNATAAAATKPGGGLKPVMLNTLQAGVRLTKGSAIILQKSAGPPLPSTATPGSVETHAATLPKKLVYATRVERVANTVRPVEKDPLALSDDEEVATGRLAKEKRGAKLVPVKELAVKIKSEAGAAADVLPAALNGNTESTQKPPVRIKVELDTS